MVVLLLGDDAVKADRAVAEAVQRSSPQLKAEALPPVFRLDDIEPEEPEARAVANRRDAANRNAVEFAEKEPLPVGRVKAMRVMEARISAFRRRPVERKLKIDFGHPAHNETFVAHRIRSQASGQARRGDLAVGDVMVDPPGEQTLTGPMPDDAGDCAGRLEFAHNQVAFGVGVRSGRVRDLKGEAGEGHAGVLGPGADP